MKPEDLLIIIDHNIATKPKPHHMNRDLIHCALQMELKEKEDDKKRN